MARTECIYKGPTGNQVFREKSSFETVHDMAPLCFYDDFLGKEILQTESGSKGIWDTVEVNLNTAIGLVADAAGGQASLAFDSDSNAEDAVLYWGDQRGIDVSKQAVFECRCKVSVLPTLTAQIVFGMVDDHNLDKDLLVGALFKFDGNGTLVLESNDTTNDNRDKASGVTVLTTEWRTYRIEFGDDLTNVKFFVDGAEVGGTLTFDMSNLTAAEAVMQPYFSLDKGADAGVGTLLVDYCKIWSNR